MSDYGWILSDPITVTNLSDEQIIIQRIDPASVPKDWAQAAVPPGTKTTEIAILSWSDTLIDSNKGWARMLTNGEDYDYGDDFPSLLGVLDATEGYPKNSPVFIPAENDVDVYPTPDYQKPGRVTAPYRLPR
jgi:hypothetical protein